MLVVFAILLLGAADSLFQLLVVCLLMTGAFALLIFLLRLVLPAFLRLILCFFLALLLVVVAWLAISGLAISGLTPSLPLGALLVFEVLVVLVEMQQIDATEIIVGGVTDHLASRQLLLELLPHFLLQRSLLSLEVLSVHLKVLELLLLQRILNIGAGSVVQEALHEDIGFVVQLGAEFVGNLPLSVELDEEVVGKLLGLVSALGLHVDVVEEDALQVVVILVVVFPVVIIVVLLVFVVFRVVQLVAIVVTVFARAAAVFIIVFIFCTEALRLKFSLPVIGFFALDSGGWPLRYLALETPLSVACGLSSSVRGRCSRGFLLRALSCRLVLAGSLISF